VEGRTQTHGKTAASVREVPLSARALDALEDVPARLDSLLVFPGPRGAYVNLRNFRRRGMAPGLAVWAMIGPRTRRPSDSSNARNPRACRGFGGWALLGSNQ
jgi:integrase